jgi:hypothetical protein
MKNSKANSKWLKISAQTNILQLISAAKETVKKHMSIGVSIPAFITTWETASTDSVATSPTPSRGKSTGQSLQKTPAKSFITKTTAQAGANADIHTN